MILLISLTAAVFLPSTSAVDVDVLTGNYTPEYDVYKGPCPTIKPFYTSPNDAMYTGLWYYIGGGFKIQQAARVSCAMWKSDFDDGGNLVNRIDLFESNVFKTVNVTWWKVKGENRRYNFLPNDDLTFAGDFFYVDKKMFIFAYVVCDKSNTSYHFKNAAVGVRRLKDVKKLLGRIRLLLNELARRNGTPTMYLIPFDSDCRYPILEENNGGTEQREPDDDNPPEEGEGPGDEEPGSEPSDGEGPGDEEPDTEPSDGDEEPATEPSDDTTED